MIRGLPLFRLSSAGAVVALALVLAVPALAGGSVAEKAHSSFEKFAKQWMTKINAQVPAAPDPALRLASSGKREPFRYRTVSVDYRTELKSTGRPAAPFVGVLHYTETVHECQGPGRQNCRPLSTSPISEIFPYQNGEWKF